MRVVSILALLFAAPSFAQGNADQGRRPTVYVFEDDAEVIVEPPSSGPIVTTCTWRVALIRIRTDFRDKVMASVKQLPP